MRFSLSSLRGKGLGKKLAAGAFLFFLVKGLVWLAIFAAGAWALLR